MMMNDSYAAINHQNHSHLISPHQRLSFCLIIAINSAEKGPEYLAKIFFFSFFWSSPSIRPKKGLNFWRKSVFGVRWNLVWTEYGPLVQKVADP